MQLRALKRVDWNWAVMLWMRGARLCPTCQIPNDFDHETQLELLPKGVFVQAWGEGMAAKVMVVQRYDDVVG